MLKKPEDYFNDLAVAKGLVRAFYDVLPGQEFNNCGPMGGLLCSVISNYLFETGILSSHNLYNGIYLESKKRDIQRFGPIFFQNMKAKVRSHKMHSLLKYMRYELSIFITRLLDCASTLRKLCCKTARIPTALCAAASASK